MKVDILSDVHLDEIPDVSIKKMVQHILPSKPSHLLIFAGDFGYDHQLTIKFVKRLRETYEKILFVLGNNDTKLRLKKDSPFASAGERVEAFLKEVEGIEGVRYLRDPIEIDGVVFGGSDLFFDFEVLEDRFGMSDEEIWALWKKKKLDQKHRGFIDDPKAYAKAEKQRIERMIGAIDVLVTHGPPHFLRDPNDDARGFFVFEGSQLQEQIQDKVWIFGHLHKRFEGQAFGCQFYNATYFTEDGPPKTGENKIIQVELAKL